jgi:glyoxylase-like metal-dependent hydrolase (beta-lactamase superfamily II)
MMKTSIKIISLLLFLSHLYCCKKKEEYQVYAIKFSDGWKIQAKDYVIGADPSDSVDVCNMFWLLKSSNGRNILVDAGFIDTTNSNKNYIRPDSMLLKLGLSSQNISDIIITHPHFDHISGITLFPRAKVWMQEEDYDYFIGPAWQVDGDNRGFEKKDVENILSVYSNGRLNLIKGDNKEVFPGIKVYIGSKHTFENQYLIVNSKSKRNKVLLASDAIWFYLNLEKGLPISICMDTVEYVKAMNRIKTFVENPDLIIAGHDNKIFSKFPKVHDWIVRIEE